MIDVTALGEILIDFTSKGSKTFEANAGGAPCNVLASLSKLSKNTAFIGNIGTDMFGKYLKKTLKELKINTDGLNETDDYFTTLAFVSLDENGEREFSFSRKFSADVMLKKEFVNENIILNSKIFHCGTLAMTNVDSCEAQLFALETAKNRNITISVDPNLRLSLWKNEESAKKAADKVLSYADIIKISDNEAEFLCGKKNILTAAMEIYGRYNPKILFVTCGKDGSYLIKDDIMLYQPAFKVNTVDTTGAGDCFLGAALSKLLDYNLDFGSIQYNQCEQILQFAVAASALVTEKYGAMLSMPNIDEINDLLHQNNSI